jgi:DMSO/TMAO reductase YedYZ molybdopterin-dependent catalytic subunit
MKEKYIAAKERWAQKMAGKAKPPVRSTDRLPPGQHTVQNFPVLDLGVRPDVPLDKWELKIGGKVENPVTLNWKQFMELPQFKDVSDFHCVTTWSQFDMEWEGVAFFTLAELVKPKPEATHVFFKSYDGYSTNNPLEWQTADSRTRRPGARDYPKALRLERREVHSGNHLHGSRHSRVLGSSRLFQHCGSLG